MRRHAKALLAVVIAMLTLGASAAFALQTHAPTAPFDGTQVPNGSFGSLGGVAVDQSGGDVYVLDTTGAPDSSGAIQRFNSAGTYLSQLTGASTTIGFLSTYSESDVAVDSSGTSSDGTAYVTDSFNNLIVAFDTTTGSLQSAFDADGELNGSQTPPASFSIPCGLAVDQSNGNLFVADQGNNRVWIFDSAGTYLGRVADSALNGPCGIALTSTGDLYVRNAYDGKVLRFNRASATDYSFAWALYAPDNGTPSDFEDDGPFATDVAVNSTDDHIYVDKGDRIAEYDAGGSAVSSFGQGTIFESRGLDLSASSGRLFASDGGELESFGPLIAVADVTTGQAQDVTDTTATLTGSLDPGGPDTTACFFEWGTDTSYGSTAPCAEGDVFDAPGSVSAELMGLAVGTEYHYRLVVENVEGSGRGGDRSFATDGAPSVASISVSEVTSVSAKLSAEINPAGAVTTYHFEYVTSDDFEASGFANAEKAPSADASLSASNAGHAVSEPVSDLSPSTKYLFRVVATNAIDTTESVEASFATFPVVGDRPQGRFPGQGFLPDNRAWEMVSPIDKNGGNVLLSTSRARAARNLAPGQPMALQFASYAGFGDAPGGGIAVDYLSVRDAKAGTHGWSTHGIIPPQEPLSFAGGAFQVDPAYIGELSPDLSKGVLQAWTPLTDDPNVGSGPVNLYARHDLRQPGTGQYSLLTACPRCDDSGPLPPIKSGEIGPPRLAGATSDMSQVIFESTYGLTPGTANNTTKKLYESDHGVTRLVGVLPDSSCGSPPCNAAESRAGQGIGSPGNGGVHTLSEDGRRVVFRSGFGSSSGLYQRIDHAETVKLNLSERVPPAFPKEATYWDASNDGQRVFFTSSEPLTQNAPEDFASHLYMWSATPDSGGHHLTLLDHDEEGGDGTGSVSGVVGRSNDGRYVYFISSSQLVAGEPQLTFGARGLFLWRDDGTADGSVAYITGIPSASVGPSLVNASSANEMFAQQSRVTPDGRSLLYPVRLDFSSVQTLHLYNADTQESQCVSCPVDGTTASSFATIPHLPFGVVQPTIETSHLNQGLTDDGGRIFFSTSDRLVLDDTNGQVDAYQYEVSTGEHRLVSSGESNAPSYFMEASPDGRDVFFATSERLSAWDVDSGIDIYDARIDGGFPEPSPPPASCQGDACQPAPLPLNDPTPASSAFTGLGNPKVARKSGKKRKGRCRGRRGDRPSSASRCQVRKQGAANDNRGAHR